ncbi:hypothetical protein [Methylocaldum sp.]|uniref:hypothetical protein n=1 Tax=Methylocaldum sp. TaxID=1969727 RepID=UPI002D759B7B|nr:hypothetical protein [Methylocaldum sp.]HYE38171.1 hypothetical protein [Methylocaldum sp.]
MPNTKTLTAFVYAHKSAYSTPEESHFIMLSGYPIDDPSFILLETRDLEVNVPEESELIPKTVAALEAKKQKIRADAHVEVEKIEDRIQSLLYLTHKE